MTRKTTLLHLGWPLALLDAFALRIALPPPGWKPVELFGGSIPFPVCAPVFPTAASRAHGLSLASNTRGDRPPILIRPLLVAGHFSSHRGSKPVAPRQTPLCAGSRVDSVGCRQDRGAVSDQPCSRSTGVSPPLLTLLPTCNRPVLYTIDRRRALGFQLGAGAVGTSGLHPSPASPPPVLRDWGVLTAIRASFCRPRRKRDLMRRRIPIAFGPSLFGPLYKPPYYRFSPFLCASSASFCHSAMCGRKGTCDG